VKIVLKKNLKCREAKGSSDERAVRPCGHKVSDTCGVHACCACYIKGLLRRHYGQGAVEDHNQKIGGITMAKKIVKAAKAAKRQEGKEKRVSAADVLVPQFGLKTVKSNEELIKMVRAETGSTKFDDKQLAWYKSQYRGGKMKGQNGKPGHPIAQGSLMKPKAAAKAKAGPKKASVEEPIED